MFTDISYLLTEWLISFTPGLLSALVYMKVKNLFIISSTAFSFEIGIRSLLRFFMIIPPFFYKYQFEYLKYSNIKFDI